ncbi:hypothetical protein ABPG72_004880 [Tetrahymena utriculariae]
MNDNGKVISRVYKVDYAQTSYQECPICKKTIQKSNINIINEEIVQYPVSAVTLKKYFHFQCYSFNQFMTCDNKNNLIEYAEGYQKLEEQDQERFYSLISGYKSKYNSNLKEKIFLNVSNDSAQNQKTLSQFNVAKNGQQKIASRDSNGVNKLAPFNSIVKTQSSLSNFTNEKQEIVYQNTNCNKNFVHISSMPENPMKQQVLAFKPTKVDNKNKQKVPTPDKAKINIKKETKALQQKMEFFRFDKSLMKPNIQKNKIAQDLKQQEDQLSEEEELFIPKSLNVKRTYKTLIDVDENNDDSETNNSNSETKIDSTSQKLTQYIYQKDTKKDNINNITAKSNINIKDPKTKKNKITIH